jgi:hypothetical protein
MVREKGVADGDMSPSPLAIVATVAEPAEGGSVVKFAKGAFSVKGGEAGDTNVVDLFGW